MEDKRVGRRRHSREFKAEVLRACREPGASVAAIALAHGVNANLVHRWLRLSAMAAVAIGHERALDSVGGEFVALRLPALPAVAMPPDIRIELRRGAASVTVSWPLAGSTQCAAWLREWLR